MIKKKIYNRLVDLLVLLFTVLVLAFVITSLITHNHSLNAFMPIYIVWFIALLFKLRHDQNERLARRKKFLNH